jgi:5-oxoprolinase (ATP-hydrolysing)
MSWEFWIDVGGTFTDCIARSPDDRLVECKVLSSGVTKRRVGELLAPARFCDDSPGREPAGFWTGYELRFLDGRGEPLFASRVTHFDARTGAFTTAALLPETIEPGMNFELVSGEESPILAIRTILGLRLDQPIPPVIVRLGTTRGTNALLTRRGARTAFITTKGFADILLIANQDRPRLFDLAIKKPEPLFERVLEIDERLDAEGQVLRSPDEQTVRSRLAELKQSGVESIAICLMHSFANPKHELLIEGRAREAGFSEISVSSKLSPLIKIVSRGDTTVVDAYLNPVLRRYVETLRRSLTGSRLRLMTSAGGLVDADRFVGKDSILSGPAGGVIGFSRVAQRAGFARSIGFDMGGTSTDVSRFDGRYELEFETKKAGVRVVAPMLAIETVAAGGGSICAFDGVKLVVGPDSAGASPGPACYGRGGPLTVTDVNLFLGRIVPDHFPFPLDRAAVELHLAKLCEEIGRTPGWKRYTPIELAEGFVQIANANMVRAIRKISVAKGYDPRDYVLVTFGGAGGQHACALARELGMRHVLSHPCSGLLSAYGIGLADIRRFGEQAVLRPYSTDELAALEPLFRKLESQARGEVAAEGIPTEAIAAPSRSLDLRYKGVEATINVPCPADGSYAGRYEELHQQLYGYRHAGREIEIVAARVEVVGRTPDPPDETAEIATRQPAPSQSTTAWFEGRPHETGVFLREHLRAGDEIAGPAILCEPTSTVLIEPGFSASILSRGEIVLTDAGSAARREISTAADPVMLEIFNNLFASIAEQMGITLQHTSFSTNVKERLDFSCAIFSPTGDLVVNAPHIPVHLGAMSETVKRTIADNPQIAPGDVFVTNDPNRGGSHLPDVTVITPVHHERTKELLFFTASRAHHAEIGGIVPGSMPPFSRNLAEEGVLIRNFKLVDAGRSREAELRELLLSGPWPTRSVRDNLADVSAQVAANNTGVLRLRELVERYSLPVVQAYMQHIQDAAERKMRLALGAIPDGVYRFCDHLDAGSPIAVTITIAGDGATVDFTGTGPVILAPEVGSEQDKETRRQADKENVADAASVGGYNLNANRAIVTAAVLYVFRCLINEDIPLNSGVLAPVKIVLPECLLNPPEHDDPAKCAAIVGGNVETSQRVVDVLLGALGVAAASQGTMNNLTFGDDTFGYYETICGGSGATRDSDGADAVHTHMTNTRLTDPEVIERRYPVRLLEFSIRRGSGGNTPPLSKGGRGGVALLASSSVSAEINRDVAFEGISHAILRAAQQYFGPNVPLDVQTDPDNGSPTLFKSGEPVDPARLGEILGRIAARTAKQIMVQSVREAERDAVIDDYLALCGRIASGEVTGYDDGNCLVKLDKAEGILPVGEQIPGELFRTGDRLSAVVLDVRRDGSATRVVLSRAHPDFVRRLFEAEIPEIADKTVEIRALSREAGYRCKIAVLSRDPKVDAVGACVGVRGGRIKKIIDQLSGERMDIIRWSDNLQVLVPNALQPAKIDDVIVCPLVNRVIAIVAEDQISLALGRAGRNARLTAVLTGWDVEIVSRASLDENIDEAIDRFNSMPEIPDELADKLVEQGIFTTDDLGLLEHDALASRFTPDEQVWIAELTKRAQAGARETRQSAQATGPVPPASAPSVGSHPHSLPEDMAPSVPPGREIHRGGDGVLRRLEFLRGLRVSILSERRGPYAPFGLDGGPGGALGENTLQRAGAGVVENLGGKVQLSVAAGDILTIATPGGGAFAVPTNAPPRLSGERSA